MNGSFGFQVVLNERKSFQCSNMLIHQKVSNFKEIHKKRLDNHGIQNVNKSHKMAYYRTRMKLFYLQSEILEPKHSRLHCQHFHSECKVNVNNTKNEKFLISGLIVDMGKFQSFCNSEQMQNLNRKL